MKLSASLLTGLMSLTVLGACTANTTDSTADEGTTASEMGHTESEHSHMSEDMAATSSDTSSEDTSVDLTNARVIEMTSTDWSFSPSTITAKKGEVIVVRLTNNQGIHSFGSKELGFNVSINPGETKDIVIPTDKEGTFSFRCLIPCGPGHRDMVGTIVIEA